MKDQKLIKKIHKHAKHNHRRYVLGAGIGFLLFKLVMLFAGGLGFIGDNFAKAEWDGGVWNNNVFIDKTFWDNSPNDQQIKEALFGIDTGDKTAYTENRSGNNCDINNITVEYKDPGTDTIPQQLSGNIIYVLNSGNYTISYNHGIWLSGCNAIIGSGKVTIYSTGYILSPYAMIYATGSQNNILDNLHIDGFYNAQNQVGIGLYYSKNNSINNFKTYNNGFYGIYINNSRQNSINNSESYNNNGFGVYIKTSYQTFINNSKFYNNNSDGIGFDSSQNSIINNSQSYNNNNHGISLGTSPQTIINNCQLYNNNVYGMMIVTSSQTIINNSQFYNNNEKGISFTSSTDNLYYGSLLSFGNGDSNLATTYITGGTNSDTIALVAGWSNGILNTGGTMSRDYITNPRNQNGEYLLDRGTGFVNLRTKKSFDTISPISYSYGSKILTQTQPLTYSGTILITGGVFDSTKYIGSNIIKKTGDLLGLSENTISSGKILTGISTSPITKYSLFGDITNYIYGQNINTKTGVTLSSGNGLKRVIVQLYDPNTYFATHFEKTGYLNSTIISNIIWNNDNFIDDNFWSQGPISSDIIIALFGIDTGDKTAYTQIWSGNNCNPDNIQVEYLSTDTIVNSLSGNYIYVLNEGDYIISDDIILNGNCIAILGSGKVNIFSSGFVGASIFQANGKRGIIFDNLNIDGTSDNINGVGVWNNTNSTINNLSVYNASYGIYYNNSHYNYFNNIISYNNSHDGIIIVEYSTNNTINNSQFFNNGLNGILFNDTQYNSVNNSQSYNNGAGEHGYGIAIIDSTGNIINNSQFFNNTGLAGIVYQNSYNNLINNSQSYNNMGGLYFFDNPENNADLTYYGTFKIFNNLEDYIAGYTHADLFEGQSNDMTGSILGRDDGQIISGDEATFRNVTNPLSNQEDYLIDWRGKLDEAVGPNASYTSKSIGYSYGNEILNQTKPVYYFEESILSGLSFDTEAYIGGVQKKYTGDIIIDTVVESRTANIQIDCTNTDSEYIIRGDVQIKTGECLANQTKTVTGINILGDNGEKNIVVQFVLPGSGSSSYGHSSRSFSLSAPWDNDYFVDKSFWNQGPNSGDIKIALFGTGLSDKTAYTKNWSSNNCNPNNISVEYINQTGINTIPKFTSGNTIYVLKEGKYSLSGYNSGIVMSGCSAIIGSGDVTIYSTNKITGSMIYVYNQDGIIIDGIDINGLEKENGSTHNMNDLGIRIENAKNKTINNARIFKNNIGIYIYASNYNILNNLEIFKTGRYWLPNEGGIKFNTVNYSIISNTRIYNLFESNAKGIGLTTSNNNIINNVLVYNVGLDGIYLFDSENNLINNTAVFNVGYSLLKLSASNYNIINNSHFYNSRKSEGKGIEFNDADENIVHDVLVFNNHIGITTDINSNRNRYFGEIKSFGNDNNTALSEPTDFLEGEASKFSNLGWINGYINNAGDIDCSYVINPVTSNLTYLQQASLCNNNGLISSWSGSMNYNYRYGSKTLKQTRPIKRSGENLIFYDIDPVSYDTGRYIGDNSKIGGTFEINNSDEEVYKLDVKLGNNILGASDMRLSHDGSNRSGWKTYNTSSDRKLSGNIAGTKNVYAEFSGEEGLFMVMDTIVYQYPYVDPQAFVFNRILGAETGTFYTSNEISLAGMSPGIDTGIYLSGSSGFSGYLFKNGINIGTGGTGGNDDKFYIELRSSNQTGTKIFAKLIVGNTSGIFEITTRPNYIANQFSFSGIVKADLNTSYTSNIITIGGITLGYSTNISVNNGYIFKNGINIGTGGTGGNGDQIILALTSSNSELTKTSSTLNIGGTSSKFDVKTKRSNAFDRDNDNFVDKSFWDKSPISGDIKYALFGEGDYDTTAYTKRRSGNNCDYSDINVQYISSGLNKIPQRLSGNTIYVLNSGNYIISYFSGIEFGGNCSAVLGSDTIHIYSTGKITSGAYAYRDWKLGGMLNILQKSYTIIDNIRIDGSKDGYGSTHDANQFGIKYYKSSSNTVNNSYVYNNKTAGIFLKPDVDLKGKFAEACIGTASNYNTIKNSKIFNNRYNIALCNASYNLIENVDVFSGNWGIQIWTGSQYNVINNLKAYKLGWFGLGIMSAYNSINNSIFFDNYGTIFSLSPDNTKLRNIQSYNNGLIGFQPYRIAPVDTGDNVEIYSTGNNEKYVNIIDGSGNYYLNRNNYTKNNLYKFESPIGYIYGTGILLQSIPAIYSGTDIVYTGKYNAGKYIGSDTIKLTGDVLGVSNSMPYKDGLVTGTSLGGASYYSIFGDIVSPVIGQNINIATGITRSGTNGQKRITVLLYNTGNGFATYFEKTGYLSTIAVNTGYIYSGTTGNNGNTGYYNGSVDIRANVSADLGLNTGSCAYSIDNGSNRSGADYSGNINSGYCYKTGIVGGTDLNIVFRIRDTGGITGIGLSKLYIFDNIAPTFDLLNDGGSGYECVTVDLYITGVDDSNGVGLHSTPYSTDGVTWTTTSSIEIVHSNDSIPQIATKTGYVRDRLGNISYKTGTYTILNSLVSANNFTGSSNVGSDTKTGDWKVLSNARDGACTTGSYIIHNGIISQGTKGICTIGTTISYTPYLNQIGGDSCIIQIRDLEGSTTDVTVYREGIDTMEAGGDTTNPTVSTGYIYNGSTGNNGSTLYYKGNIDIKADVSDNVGISGASCEYTLNNGTNRYSANYNGNATVGYCYKTGIAGGSDLNIKFKVKDTSDNVGTGIARNYIYDNVAPVPGGSILDYSWALQGYATGYNEAKKVISDNSGNVYVIGQVQGIETFGSTLLTGGGSFLSKVSSTGLYLRTIKLGGDETNGIAMDQSGNIYVAGSFVGTGIFGNTTFVSSPTYKSDIFISKISNTGAYLWTVRGGGYSNDSALVIDVDSGGNTYVAGYFVTESDFGLFHLTGFGWPDGDIFVTKLSNTGSYLRAVRGGGRCEDMPYGLDIDNTGNVYIAGSLSACGVNSIPGLTSTFGSITLVNKGWGDTLVAKLSLTGQRLRAVRGGGTGINQANDIVVDSGGNSYVAGEFRGATGDFGSTILYNDGGSNTFVSKISNTGSYIRAFRGGGSANGIAIDSGGNIYVGGSFGGTGIFGPYNLVSKLGGDIFIAKLSNTGVYKQVIAGGGIGNDVANGITIDESGNVYAVGYFNSIATFGSTTLIGSGYRDILITKLYNISGLFAINGGDMEITDTTGITLHINCSIDAGIGGVEIAYGNSVSPTNRTGCAMTKSRTLTAGNGMKTVSMRTRDSLGNISSDYTDTIELIDSQGDTIAPIVSQTYIYNGTTGYNNPNYYYKGTVDIKADVSDDIALNTSSCEYTTGSGRYPASYNGNATAGYCYKTSLIGGSDLNINFRVQDTSDKRGTGTVRNYLYDNVAPDFTGRTINWSSAIRGGGPGNDEAKGVATDNNGNIYIVGSFSSATTFGSFSFPSPGNSDVFLTKVSSTGQYLRAVRGGGNNLNQAAGVASDNSGNAYIIGDFWLTGADFGNFNLSNSGWGDIFVAKVSSTGQYLRAVRGGGDNADYVKGVATDDDGNIYVAGYFKGVVNFGNFNLLTTGGQTDIFVAKLSSTGQYLRVVKGGSNGDDQAYGVSTDNDGNIYVAGNFTGNANFGNFNLSSNGQNDVFVAKLSSTGQYLWAVKGGGTSQDLANGISTDNDGNIYVAGNFTGNANFGNFNLSSNGQNDVFVAKLSSTGQYLFALRGGGTGDDKANGISTDNDGNIYVAGNFSRPLATFGNTSLYTSGNSSDIFIAKIPSGPTNLFAINNGITVTNSANVILNITCPTDAGIGGVEIAYGNSPSPTNRTTCETTKPWTLSAGNGQKTVYMRTRDSLDNVTSDYTDTIELIGSQSDTIAPTISQAYIYNGTTGYNNPNYYYKGTVDIKADVSDDTALNTSSCEYTTGSGRYAASYNGDSTAGYCYKTNIVGGSDLNINFRVKDSSDNQGTGTARNYIYDNVGPSQVNLLTPSNNTTIATGTASLTRSTSTDAGIGMSGYYYQMSNTSNFTSIIKSGNVLINTTTIIGLTNNSYYWRVYAFDKFGNLGNTSDVSSFVVDITLPIISINNPNSNPAQSKTISASTNEGILYQAVTNGSVCNTSLDFGAYQILNFTSEADNGKNVCYKAVDSVSNTSYLISNTIQGIDNTAPTITINNPDSNPAQSKTISASTNEGTLYQVVTNGNICDASLEFGSYQILNFTSESNNGKKVCYKAVDNANNISYNMSASIQGIDKTNPIMTIISPESTVGTSAVIISINTNENSECRYSTNAGSEFTAMTILNGNGTGYIGNHNANEGTNNLYFKCKDIAGNIADEIQHTFVMDTINPVAQFVTSTLPASITNSNVVNISISGSNLSSYKYKLVNGNSCVGVVYDGATGSLSTPITQGPSESDQTYSYCIIGYNEVAGWSITGNKYTFIYDNTAPVITINDGANSNRNNGDNINLNVNYNLAGAVETKYIESNGGTCNAGVDFGSAISYTLGTNLLINSETYNSKYLCFRSSDLAGNISYTGVGVFKIDMTAPVSSITDSGSARRKNDISFSLTCNDGLAGCQNTHYKILNGDVTCDAGNYLTYAGDLSINANGGETLMKSICYYSVDTLGNNETYKKQLYKIDKQGPSINLVSPASGSSNNGSSTTFVRSGIDNGVGISGYTLRLYTNGSALITGITLTGTNIVISNLLNGDYLWNVEGSDILGNTGISNTQTFSNTSNYVILPSTGTLSDFISAFTGRGYLLGTGAILFDTGSLSGVLVGKNDIYFGNSNLIQSPVIIGSSGGVNKIEVRIESGTLITKTGSNASACDNLLLAPNFVPRNIAINLTTDQEIFSTFMLGNSCNNVSLRFSNNSGTNKNITVRLSDANLDQGEYNIWYSENGIDRDILGTSDYDDGKLEFITNHMTYFAITKDKNDVLDSLLSFLGGGSKKLSKDNCTYKSGKKNLPGANKEGKDYSDSYYDGDCGEAPSYKSIIYDGSIEGSKYSDELNKAYLYSYRAGITTISDVNRADMMGGLYRKHMAKMLSNYAINILGKKPDNGVNCDFVDMDYEDAEMQEYATKACQLGLMGLNSDGTPSNKFYPGGLVTRSQFGTALSRLLYGDEHNASVGENRYAQHLAALKSSGIMSQVSNPNMTEKRGYVMLMLMRSGIN